MLMLAKVRVSPNNSVFDPPRQLIFLCTVLCTVQLHCLTIKCILMQSDFDKNRHADLIFVIASGSTNLTKMTLVASTIFIFEA